MEHENITDVILSAVKMAVTPLNDRISKLEAQLRQEDKEPEFPHDVWERATEMAKAKGRF